MYNHYAYMSREVWNFFVEFLPINEMLGFYHLYDLPVYNFVPVYDVFFLPSEQGRWDCQYFSRSNLVVFQ